MLFQKKKAIPIILETLPEDLVQFKPIFGIKPGIYLGIVYSVLILVLLFCLLVLPGILKPGSLLVVTSTPEGAAVRIDGTYYNSTPCTVFVPSGEHNITVLLSHFTTYEQNITVKPSIFASLFFPKKVPLNVSLETQEPVQVLLEGVKEFAAWSFVGETTPAYQIPSVLSESVYRASYDDSETLNGIFMEAARFTATKSSARDLLRAKVLGDNNGLATSPLSLLKSAEDIIRYLSDNPETAPWLKGIIVPEDTLSWFQKRVERTVEPTEPGQRVLVESLWFRDIGPFLIAEDEVTSVSWDRFIEVRPEWKIENTGFWLESPTIAGTTWYAAQAYCEWLTTLLPSTLAHYTVRLPTETEWEQAARADVYLNDIIGGLWEWCDDYYVPFNDLPRGIAIEGPYRSVRGGSWVNAPAVLSISTRGSLPPDIRSYFVSFRPIIVPR
ncbi:MAG: SUMF1/EgtB/PvdO family nonheme iron enzyme [Treponema sp.]|jgi:hypothetical protein|nr:SUMF1/EgtB/PvdO family nonheme iron enzyme [Treponema sp.]